MPGTLISEYSQGVLFFRMSTYSDTIFSRYISRMRPVIFMVGLNVLLLLIPAIIILLSGLWEDAFTQGYWRPMLFPIVGIFYIVSIAPAMDRTYR